MNGLTKSLAIALVFTAASAPSRSDDLSGAGTLLCTPGEVQACYPTGECANQPPWELNVPQFIEVDLEAKILRTTKASGIERSTPIKNMERADGLVFVQGVEAGRAFSFLINEETGRASVAVTRESMIVTIFGACTPIPSSR